MPCCKRAPENSVFLLPANLLVVCKENGVIGDDALAGREDALDQVAHPVENPIVQKQVIHKELDPKGRKEAKVSQEGVGTGYCSHHHMVGFLAPGWTHSPPPQGCPCLPGSQGRGKC